MSKQRTLRAVFIVCAIAIGITFGALRFSARAQHGVPPTPVIGRQANGTYLVPTGQTIDPAGENFTFESRPLDIALRPDGKIVALMLPDQIRLFDLTRNRFLDEAIPGQHSFGGLVWSRDGSTLYSTGRSAPARRGRRRNGSVGPAPGATVMVTQVAPDGKPRDQEPIPIAFNSRIEPNLGATDATPDGLALSPDGKTLYVGLFNNSTLAAIDLTTYDPSSGNAKYVEVPTGSSPEQVVVSKNGDKIYVANRAGKTPEDGDTKDTIDPVVVDHDTYKVATGTVSVIDAKRIVSDPEHAVVRTIRVGLQPTAMKLSPDGSRLFVANANSESVTVISTESDNVIETIPTSPAPGKLAASCPNGLAVSHDGDTLYVTLGGDNAVEQLTLDRMAGGRAALTRIAGLIPTAWFPLAVTLDRDGRRLLVINSKGIGSAGGRNQKRRRLEPGAATPEAGPGGTITNGSETGRTVFSVLGSLNVIPVPDAHTLATYTTRTARNDHFDRMAQALHSTPDPIWARFKHVVFIIKENRTYDQVLGDIPVPAGHIGGAPSLVMFGEKITPNHHAIARDFGLLDNMYCTGAISADGHHWLNEAFSDDYLERAMNKYPRTYPCCGSDPLSYAGNQFLWQAALNAGKTFRDYGEYAPLQSMRRHAVMGYDSTGKITPDRNRDVAHAEHVVNDLTEAEAGTGNRGLADLTFIWLNNNHTFGTMPGMTTPESCLADNDLALGKIVDYISHSKRYWHDEPTAIFVVEDDAQGGLDHVEGHRTVGFVISPFNRRGQIVSTNYNQLNMVRTIEVILGLKPLNQFDAAALPMRDCFQPTPNYAAYTAQKNQIALNLQNPRRSQTSGVARRLADVSATLDFSAPDRADPEKLTEVLWHHTHADSAYPPEAAAAQ